MEQRRFEIEWGGRPLIIEIGRYAAQTNGSCTVQYGNTLVLATCVLAKTPREGVDFLPLLVDYEERLYAAGKIKGSRWVKREGRPTDEAIITARLVDRVLRPLFNEQIRNDIQVMLTVLSFDQENDPDIVSLIAASTALSISNIPWDGPIAGVRVGRINGEWILNSTYEAREKSDFDLVIAGTEDKVLMIEVGANEVPEEIIYEAIVYGQKHFSKIMELISKIQKEMGQKKDESVFPEEKPEKQEVRKLTQEFVNKHIEKTLFDSVKKTKQDKKEAISRLKEELSEYLEEKNIGKERRILALNFIDHLVKERVSQFILAQEKRVDGRKLTEIRPLTCEIDVLPHNHGSAMFKRGGTQVLSIITLGSPGEEQFLDTMEESGKKRYFHHYNFPPFCVGEVAPVRSPGRREIGHGVLAEKAIIPILPTKEEFPYTIRVVSEVLESNGSSSMASACASSMSLMAAGVPIKKQTAGIAIGLASEEDKKGNILKYKIITDLQDLEDGDGGMDFKVTGTKDGITAIQMDTKTHGLTQEIIKRTLERAKQGRLEILEAMNKVISNPRPEVSPFAPKICSFHINPEKIREVIGPGGKIINEIIDQTGVTIDIEQDGSVFITSDSEEALKKAEEWVKNLSREVKVGEIFQGKVVRILDFGAFVEILPRQDGMVHISELAPYRVNKVEDIVEIGDIIPVKVIKIDEQGRINLSLKEAKPDYKEKPKDYRQTRQSDPRQKHTFRQR